MSIDYVHARDARDALALAAAAPKALFVAGGTSFAAAGGPPKGARLVDVTRAGIDRIDRDAAALRVGAATPVARIAASAEARGFAGGLLAEAARAIGSPQIRNQVTVGGNLLAGHAWSAFPPALLALEATLVFLGEAGEVRVRYAEWLDAKPAGLPPLLVGVECPDPGGGARGAFLALRKSAIDFPLVTLAAVAPAEGAPRFALFGCTRRPLRLRAFESAPGSPRPPDGALEALAATQAASLEIAGGYRIDPDHARAVVAEFLTRATRQLSGGR